jgi:hypothetical protein
LIIDEDEYNALTGAVVKADDDVEHYGIKRKSGRYPWGSGETPHERAATFQSSVKDLRAQGVKDTEIAKGFGLTVSQFRTTVAMAKEERNQALIIQAQRLRDKGLSNVAIGQKMGIPDTTVGNLLKPGRKDKENVLAATSEMLRAQVDAKKYVDVGKGVELHLGISAEKLRDARRLLEDEGYVLHRLTVEQLGTGKNTSLKVLTAPGTTFQEVLKNRELIQPAMLKSTDGGRSYDRIEPPISISSKRVKIRYAEEGGTDADGVIYVRPGVNDVALGKGRYAQVRVAVDGTHYLKGMAMYGDPKDFPPGVDLVFNTNKKNTGNKLDAMKPMQKDNLTGEISKDDPFGSNIRDQVYKKHPDGTDVRDEHGNRVVESTMNIVNEEGKWDQWSRNLSSQMLSKQKPALAKNQLDMAYESKLRELDEIRATTNDTVKKHLLEKFADSADSSAVHLKAAQMPRQATKVILPINSMKENEVYAPTFNDGEQVVLVRFPHGGKFEIPQLRVNNRHPEAKKLLGNAPDAIGIHSKVAERLSGADFDGDTVLVIPNNHGKIQTSPALEGLKGFDPQKYKIPADSPIPRMNAKTKAMQMGLVSNLITDMTIKGAPDDELARAVRHSMVVIDAEKHGLNWKQSAQDNTISQLMKKYQRGPQGGASTLISLASSEKTVPDRKPRPADEGGPIDRLTGKRVYVETGKEYYNGKQKTVKIEKLALTDDAHSLSSGRPIEHVYAEYSNKLKALANMSRKEMLETKDIEYSPRANKAYAEEVKMLQANLNNALRNAPLERQAQVIANARFRLKKEANPEMDKAEIKKLKSKELEDARRRVGAGKDLVTIEPKEWEAIQAGAITKTMLNKILDNADVEKIKKLATPREKPAMNEADLSRARLMLIGDKHTLAEVANQLGVSVDTLKSAIAGDS